MKLLAWETLEPAQRDIYHHAVWVGFYSDRMGFDEFALFTEWRYTSPIFVMISESSLFVPRFFRFGTAQTGG